MVAQAFRLTPAEIANIVDCPITTAEAEWPVIFQALNEQGLTDRASIIATVATIGTEVPGFAPINEYGDAAYFTHLYENRPDLGNTHPGDGARFHGRGFIQLTGRANYARFGELLGVDLVNNPDLALRPDIAARVLAAYMRERQVADAARQGNWQLVRERVNGGLNGWVHFDSLVQRLEALPTDPATPQAPYNDSPGVAYVMTAAQYLRRQPAAQPVDGPFLAVGTHVTSTGHATSHWREVQTAERNVGWVLRANARALNGSRGAGLAHSSSGSGIATMPSIMPRSLYDGYAGGDVDGLGAANGAGGGAATTMVDHGGSVLTNVHVQLIFWGSAWDGHPAPSRQDIANAVQHILWGPYMTALSQYRQIGNGEMVPPVVFRAYEPPSVFSNADVEQLITAAIAARLVPAPDTNAQLLYCVIMPEQVRSNQPELAGEHSYFLHAPTGRSAHYAWVLNNGTLDFVTSVFSHELVEACTNTEGDAFQINPFNAQAWNEIGDKCECDFSAGLGQCTVVLDGIRVQKYWSQYDGACIVPLCRPHPSEVPGHLVRDCALKPQPNHTSPALEHVPAHSRVMIIPWKATTNGELWQRARWRATEGWVPAAYVTAP